MIRIKVYKASQLAVAGAAILLAAALAVVLISMFAGGGNTAADRQVMNNLAAEEVTAAFSVSRTDPIMPPSGEELPENEHTDEEAQGIIVEIVRPDKEEKVAEQVAVHPRVLIYHTHTHEAYRQVENDPYEETEVWRTADQTHSVVRVGEALSQLLTAYGFEVVHDTTDHEPPKLSTAYSRSLKTLEGYAGQHFDLYIDLHRDAYNASLEDCAYAGGQEAAQLMVLIGNGGEYEVKPDYEANLRFAALLTDEINQRNPGLCRDVMVKNGRYNQHVGTPAILIEVGHNENTLQQALVSMQPLADALQAIMKGGGA